MSGRAPFRALINHFGGGAAPHVCSRAETEREIEAARKLGVDFVGIGEGTIHGGYR
jgi:hypothetical protein